MGLEPVSQNARHASSARNKDIPRKLIRAGPGPCADALQLQNSRWELPANRARLNLRSVVQKQWAALDRHNTERLGQGRESVDLQDLSPVLGLLRKIFGFSLCLCAPVVKWVLMAEMPHSGEHHRQPQSVRCFDGVLVAHRAARLNDRRSSCLCDFLDVVGEREERVGSRDCSFER